MDGEFFCNEILKVELTKERNDSFNWYLVSDWDVLSGRCTFNDYVYIICNICVLHLLPSVHKLPIFGNSQKKMRSNVKKNLHQKNL